MSAGKRVAYKFLSEFLWWILSAVSIYAVMRPIWIQADFKFNGLFILSMLLFFHYFRYILSFSRFPLFTNNVVKFVWFTLNFPLFFVLLKQYQNMIDLYDGYSIFEFVNFFKIDLSLEGRAHLMNYIYQVFVITLIGAALLTAIMQLRIGYSLFRGFRKKNQIQSNET